MASRRSLASDGGSRSFPMATIYYLLLVNGLHVLFWKDLERSTAAGGQLTMQSAVTSESIRLL